MLMQNFGVTNKEYCGMLWYFLEWSINNVLKSVMHVQSCCFDHKTYCFLTSSLWSSP